jgi:hypothetical protein
MARIKSIGLCSILLLTILVNAVQAQPAFSASGKIKELLSNEKIELYIDRMTASEIPDSQEQKISITGICKNLRPEPSACVDIFFFSLIGSSGKQYQPKLTESKILPPRLPPRDIMQGTLTFVIPKSENATQLIYSEPDSKFTIDLSSTKSPADKPPVGEWRLARNKGVTLSDSRIELKIYDEILDRNRYVLDISITNIGKGLVNYNALYAYLKSASGFLYSADIYASVEPKIDSGTLQPGMQIRGKIAFDVGGESGLFMLIYDDIAGSYLSTGQFVPISLPLRGKVIDDGDSSIKISKYNTYTEPVNKAFRIVGEVSNDSENFASGISIHTVLKDKSGIIISEQDRILRNFLSSAPLTLAPKTKVPFFVDFDISKTAKDSIGSYELSLKYSFSEAKSASLQVGDVELIQASKPTPLSTDILWQIKGKLLNKGDVRSTDTHVIASLYDSQNNIIGVGGYSVLDKQPKDFNPQRIEPFTIEISLPTSFKPSSFYVYAESSQFIIEQPKASEPAEDGGKEVEIGIEDQEPLLTEKQNGTLVNVKSKQRESLMALVIRNLPNSSDSIYSIRMEMHGAGADTLETKLRWENEKGEDNEIMLFTTNNPIRPGQEGRFLFHVEDQVSLIVWRAYDLDAELLLDGEVQPFQIKFGEVRE